MSKRILLVDDHEVVRAGMASLLQTSWTICGEAGNGLEAIDKVMELKPDLVLLDLRMPVMGGTEAAREIRRLAPRTKIVFVSMYESESVAKLARLAGADACLSKSCASADLHTAIAAVLREPGDPLRLLDAT